MALSLHVPVLSGQVGKLYAVSTARAWDKVLETRIAPGCGSYTHPYRTFVKTKSYIKHPNPESRLIEKVTQPLTELIIAHF